MKPSRQARSMGRCVGLLRETQVFVGPGLVGFFFIIIICFVLFLFSKRMWKCGFSSEIMSLKDSLAVPGKAQGHTPMQACSGFSGC